MCFLQDHLGSFMGPGFCGSGKSMGTYWDASLCSSSRKPNQGSDDLEWSALFLALWLGLPSPCVLSSLSRFDYEGLEPKTTYYIMRDLEALVTDKSFVGQQFAVGNHVYSVAKTDCFEYVDPVDGTVTKKQVLARKSLERAKPGVRVSNSWNSL